MNLWWALKEKGLRKQYESKIERIIQFLLNEFGDELRTQIKEQITESEIEKLMSEAKARVLKIELPKLRTEIESNLQDKFDSMMLEHLEDFFSEFAPIKEETVVSLFHRFQNRLGFTKCEVRHIDYDCLCMKEGKQVRIEFEKKSKDFISHGHKKDKVDLIVCWVDNIDEIFSVPILELSRELAKIFVGLSVRLKRNE